ncbi:MAG: TfoX/Sxy family protein [Nitrospinota bacterium]|nr:TfoX/Sxy family protein [Nitrospinota bacterium]MDH5755973.1 TfoX/Sxy family protein [Nitrospinota bacterium]
MAYDEKLAEKVRTALLGLKGMQEKKMFGGLCFLLDGNMVAGVAGERLMVRVGVENHQRAMKQKHAMPMDFTGKPMRGMIFVAAEGTRRGDTLAKWLKMGLDHARTLPKK